MTLAIAWIAAGIAFGLLDALWLSNAVPRIYRPMIGELLGDKINIGAAAAFYLIYISGIVFFAVSPALQDASLTTALWRGAALGFLAFATYNLTNQSTLAVWPLRMTVIDMSWGTFATAAASAAGYAAASRFG
jgi:uncharacterized membrane protein